MQKPAVTSQGGLEILGATIHLTKPLVVLWGLSVPLCCCAYDTACQHLPTSELGTGERSLPSLASSGGAFPTCRPFGRRLQLHC